MGSWKSGEGLIQMSGWRNIEIGESSQRLPWSPSPFIPQRPSYQLKLRGSKGEERRLGTPLVQGTCWFKHQEKKLDFSFRRTEVMERFGGSPGAWCLDHS